MNTPPSSASIDTSEIKKFSEMSDIWWDKSGPLGILHAFNPVRIAYIRDYAFMHFKKPAQPKPLAGLSLLDIGCGGGLLSEPMARLGAKVTAIDASYDNIIAAANHAKAMHLSISYQHQSAEDLAATGVQFDIVLCMEIIEHVADVRSFLAACSTLVKPGGIIYVATLNRTLPSFLFAIAGAEYILRWLPRGTHHWKKFLKPSEITTHLTAHNLHLRKLTGVSFNPVKKTWTLSNSLSVNYILIAEKLCPMQAY